MYTSDIGRSTVTDLILRTLMDEGKLESLEKVRAPGAEIVPTPRSDEAVVFVTFFNAGLRFPCVDLVSVVLQLYGVELAQLTNSLMRLGVFEWILRSAGTSGEGSLFAYLHDGKCQLKKKNSGETLSFDSANFQPKAQMQMYVAAPAALNRWDTNWTRRWFYHTSPVEAGLQSSGGLIELIVSPEIVLTSR